MIPPRWILTTAADPSATQALAAELRIPEALAAILVQRGIASAALAKAFLRPDLERLSDPHCWADMPAALELLQKAVREKRTKRLELRLPADVVTEERLAKLNELARKLDLPGVLVPAAPASPPKK